MNSETYRRNQLAEIFLKLSYKEGDFTLSSGKKSNYYFDCRVTALHHTGLYLIGEVLFDYIESENIARGASIRGVGGLTMGADPLVASVIIASRTCEYPLYGLLVRKESKGHGTNQYVEGLANSRPMDSIVVLEDVVTTGSSLIKACDRITEAGLHVAGTLAILDREEGGRERIKEAGYEFRSVFTKTELFRYKN